MVVSCVATLSGVFFAWKLPPPKIYVSTGDGVLVEVEMWSYKPEYLSDALIQMESEEASLLKIKGAESEKIKKSIEDNKRLYQGQKAPEQNNPATPAQSAPAPAVVGVSGK